MSTQSPGASLSDHDLLVEIHAVIVHNLVPQQADHETRIRRLERMVWIAVGAAATMGGTVGGIAANLFH